MSTLNDIQNTKMAGINSVALLCLIGAAFVAHTDAFAISVEAHEQECFFEETTTGTKVRSKPWIGSATAQPSHLECAVVLCA